MICGAYRLAGNTTFVIGSALDRDIWSMKEFWQFLPGSGAKCLTVTAVLCKHCPVDNRYTAQAAQSNARQVRFMTRSTCVYLGLAIFSDNVPIDDFDGSHLV